MRSYDAIVIGSGPNGLAAAIALAQAGCSVLVVEAKETIGGGARSAELTLPGFVHDVCSAIHPTSLVSPFLRTLPLEQYGLQWAYPSAEVAHPLDDGTAAMLERSLEDTGRSFDDVHDARAYRALMEPLTRDAMALYRELLGPIGFPSSPILMMRFGLRAMRSASSLARGKFRGARARALFAGCAAHSFLPLERMFTAAFGLVLGVAAHAVGWPCARGGSSKVIDALAGHLRSLGGEIETGRHVRSLDELPAARAYLFDTTPAHLAAIAGERLPAGYRARLNRFRQGPGVFKIDCALSGPIPWKCKEVARAGTVHLGGTLDEIAAGEAAIWRGEHSDRPYVLLAQQSMFDDTRAPAGKHTCWAYCHVPAGSTRDMTEILEAQIERFAPGYRDLVLARHTYDCAKFERYNPNYVGGDIAGGSNELSQLFTRPLVRVGPYSTPNRAIYLCSSSTPPGGGVHGMCGFSAARAALRRVFGRRIAVPALGAPNTPKALGAGTKSA